jgi:hypothetical protein
MRKPRYGRVEGVFFGMGVDDSRRKLTDGRIEVGRVARPGGGRHGWPESRLLGPHRNVNGRPPSQNFGVALDFCPVNLICILISSRLSICNLPAINGLGFQTMRSGTG